MEISLGDQQFLTQLLHLHTSVSLSQNMDAMLDQIKMAFVRPKELNLKITKEVSLLLAQPGLLGLCIISIQYLCKAHTSQQVKKFPGTS